MTQDRVRTDFANPFPAPDAGPASAALSPRPWPAPRGPWVMSMRWLRLAFMHWPVKAELLGPLLPRGLTLDTFEGGAWIGVVPFMMANVRPRLLPSFPGTGTFPELNVRTYVTHDGKPGVWFFSLDAASRLAVRGARRLFHLPYFDAAMCAPSASSETRYKSFRTHRRAPAAEFAARYRPSGDTFFAQIGTIDHFLTSRYCLYAANRRGRLFRGEISHTPWPLHRAEAEIEINTMALAAGVVLPDCPPVLHYVEVLDVVAWPIRRV